MRTLINIILAFFAAATAHADATQGFRETSKKFATKMWLKVEGETFQNKCKQPIGESNAEARDREPTMVFVASNGTKYGVTMSGFFSSGLRGNAIDSAVLQDLQTCQSLVVNF